MSFEEKRRRLVLSLKEEGYILSKKVEKAMLKVPRELFVPKEYRDLAYSDKPLPIGHGQTISAPSIVAYMTELLKVDIGHKVLEVGTGSGYQAAILAEIVAPETVPKEKWGHLYTIERIPQLAEYAKENLRKTNYLDRVTIIVGDGTEGFEDEAPYNRIIVTAAAPKVPEPLIEQLKLGGIMVIPVGSVWEQSLVIVEKTFDGKVITKKDLDVLFVPLVGKYGWKKDL